MSLRRLVALASLVILVAALPAEAGAKGGGGKHGGKDRPSRVLILILDQARPDTITRYGMKNVQKLQRDGMSFPNALVGHMAAETVISHNVLTSGLFPKNMGWTNEVYRDVGGVLGAPGAYHVTSSMSCAQYGALIQAGGYPKLQDYLDAEFGESSRFVSIAQKRSAACPAGQTSSLADGTGTGTDPEDIIFQIRGSSGASCDGASGWRQPEFIGTIPAYFAELATPCNRWWTWQASGAYGTGSILPAKIYPLDGNRFVPGFDPAHIGGDTWSADAAIRVIQNDPTWRGMLVSLGGIDKLGHMWGADDEEPGFTRLPATAKNADEQVGRIMDALRARGLLEDTLVVVTADHAGQTGERFQGRFDGFPPPDGNACDPATGSTGIRSDCNWYLGQDADERYLDPSPAVAQLRNALAGNLAFSYQDGHVAVWLNDDSEQKKREAAAAVLKMPGVIASYRINESNSDYRLSGVNRMDRRERAWFQRYGERLVDTMAAPNGPQVVGLVASDVTYGAVGDHGGHSRLIQNIPMVFYGAGVGSRDSGRDIRLVDVLPTVLEEMGIDYDEDDFDGEAVRLSGRR